MCTKCRRHTDVHAGHTLFDESSGDMLDPLLVASACEEELKRFVDMKVYHYVQRSSLPENANIVNVKWVHVRNSKGASGEM